MTPIAELIGKLERATGPDRELDYEIGRAVIADDWRDIGNGNRINRASYRQQRIGDSCPTASVDAVLALAAKLLPGRSADILREALSDLGKRFRWHIALQQPGQMEQLPIAICLALLRALSSQKPENANG
jgi:hypothetical protein